MPVFTYTSDTPFPGYAALAPVIGTVLLLRDAAGSRIGALLSWRPLVFIGLISYSAYLWHQPLFALARYSSLSGQLDTVMATALSAVTLILAAITWRWIETPFRDRRLVSPRALVWTCIAATIAVAIPSAVLAFGGDTGLRSPIASNVVGRAMLSLFTDCDITKPTRGLGRNGCLLDPSSLAAPTFLVVGDSHAEALFPAFAKISRDTGAQGRLLQHIGCSPLLEASDVPSSTPDCLLTREHALALVAEQHVPTVFLVSRFAQNPGPMEEFEKRLAKTIDAYARRGAIVQLVMQAPEQPRFLRRHYHRAVMKQRFLGVDVSPAIAAMAVTTAEHDQKQAFVRTAFAKYRDDGRVRVIDFSSALCDERTCSVGTAREPYYSDQDHVSAIGALLVSDAIRAQSRALK